MARESRTYRAAGYDYDQYWARGRNAPLDGDFWGASFARQRRDLHQELAPLLERLRQYDAMRLHIETRGGHVSQLASLTQLVKEPLTLAGGFRQQEVCLTDPAGLTAALREIDWNLSFQVRFKRTKLPVYYLCRVQGDYWSEYSMIIEDYHLSPGYPLPDERFAKLLSNGHENHFLRIAKFRDAAAKLTERAGRLEPRGDVDDRLLALGRHIFQAAWHQDQQMGLAIARHFGLPGFSQAVELLYLCLSGELCELRGAVDEFMLDFFLVGHPQPALREFLLRLPALDGKRLNDLPRKALGLYARLGKAFGGFISTEVAMSQRHQDHWRIPLWKYLYANINRLDLVTRQLADDAVVTEAAGAIERQAQGVIKALLDEMG